MAHGHAEIHQVWPKDGRVRVVGRIVDLDLPTGVAAGSLTLTNRDRPHLVVRCPATLTGRRFEASFAVDLIASASAAAVAGDQEVWDLHLEVPGGHSGLRVGRHLDDIPNKKKVMTFPAQVGGTARGFVSVKPYYTVEHNLSLICRPAQP
ncbi:hypothetical protein [Sphaerisporangium perillae]|uniref:hypothetical protein n=1 Tax=Sphaerisporangium perillae TaxID=2935860 RepID=UPI00200C336E|nr:hypothetical protein [Sphaerisporangium perillae]